MDSDSRTRHLVVSSNSSSNPRLLLAGSVVVVSSVVYMATLKALTAILLLPPSILRPARITAQQLLVRRLLQLASDSNSHSSNLLAYSEVVRPSHSSTCQSTGRGAIRKTDINLSSIYAFSRSRLQVDLEVQQTQHLLSVLAIQELVVVCSVLQTARPRLLSVVLVLVLEDSHSVGSCWSG